MVWLNVKEYNRLATTHGVLKGNMNYRKHSDLRFSNFCNEIVSTGYERCLPLLFAEYSEELIYPSKYAESMLNYALKNG